MIHARPTAAPASDDPPVDTATWRLGLLVELTEIGMELARAVRRDVAAAAEEEAACEPAHAPASPDALAAGVAARRDLCLAFSRVSRAVRQTLGLHARLEAGVSTAAQAPVSFAEQASGALERVRARLALLARREKVEGTVREAIQIETADVAEVRRLVEVLDERLERDYRLDFGDQPIGEMVALICRDLGLNPDWNRWAFEDWAREEAESRALGSPFADWAGGDRAEGGEGGEVGIGFADSG